MESFNICDFCKYGPPSSGDGKPCVVCPADLKDNVADEIQKLCERADRAERAIDEIADARRKTRLAYIVDDILRKVYEERWGL